MTGFDLMQRLKDMLQDVPMALMTGFGYDPGHSIVRARQAGLKSVLYKPFRLDQLLETIELIVTGRGKQPGDGQCGPPSAT
jgi:DNA-binding NtrC family response regulator